MFAKLFLSLATGFVFLSVAGAQTELAGIKCVVDGAKAASVDYPVSFKEGHIYFSSERCAKQFVRDLEREPGSLLVIKANHQLIVTGQYVQSGCPVTGDDVGMGQSVIPIGGVTIRFCCRQCLARIEGLKSLSARAEAVYSDKAFAKAFKIKQVRENDVDN